MSHEILPRQEEKPFVVVGVINAEGPAAIKSGNKAIILSDGSIEGWWEGTAPTQKLRVVRSSA